MSKLLKHAGDYVENGADLFSCDGVSFALAMRTQETETQFLQLLSKSYVVIFARLSPTQKAQICQIAKYRLGTKILAVGDGYNDQQMLAASHCGVKMIHDTNTSQNAQNDTSSDFTITEF